MYFGKTPRLGIYLHPDISSTTAISFNTFDDTVYSYGDWSCNICCTISNLLSSTTTLNTLSGSSTTISNSVISKSSYILKSFKINSVNPGEVGSYSMNTSCSTDGTYISPVLMLADGSSLPSWILYDSDSDMISWTAPVNTSDTELSLLYCVTDPAFTDKTGCTSVTLNLIQSSSSSSSNTSPSSTSSSSTSSNSNQSDDKASKIKEFNVSTLVSVGVIVLLSVSMGVFNLSSMTVIWMIFGQMKVCQFLLLQDGYVSEYVKEYILGFKLSLLSFSFIDFKDKVFLNLPEINIFINYFDYDQENSTIKDLGYDSGSAFVNNINFLTTFLFTIALHLVILIFNKILSKFCKITNQNCLMKMLIKIQDSFMLGKHYEKISAYIRLQIEAFQGILITSISEILHFHTESSNKIASLSICIIIVFVEIIIWIIIGYQWLSLKREINSDEWKNYSCIKYNGLYKEIKKDLKESFPARGYMFIDISRTLIFSVLAFCIPQHQIYEMIFFQLIYLILIIIIRPFDKVHLNIIKIQNEIYFMFFTIYMAYFNTQSRWTSTISPFTILSEISTLCPFESLFILLMTSTSIFTLIILLTCMVVSLCKKIASSSNPIIPKQTMPVPFNHVPSVSVSVIEEIKVESSDSKNMKLSKYFNNVGRSKAKEIREGGS